MSEDNKLQVTKQEVKAITPPPSDMDAVELTLMQGDLSRLTLPQRKSYVQAICDSLGLNRLTRPFDYLSLDGKLVLYCKKDATEQLRKIHDVSMTIISKSSVNDLYIVTAKATMPNGRTDEATGAVSILGLKGKDLANAIMKAETKAKRRVTLSICGLGFIDETEIDSIENARIIPMDLMDKEEATADRPHVLEAAKPAPKPEAKPTAPAATPPPSRPAPAAVPKPQASDMPPPDNPGFMPEQNKTSPYVTYPENLPPEAPRSADPAQQAAMETPEPKISQAQVRRLYTIAGAAGWKDAGLKQFMRDAFDIDSSLQLTPKKYDWLCSVVEKHTYESAMDTLHRAQNKPTTEAADA